MVALHHAHVHGRYSVGDEPLVRLIDQGQRRHAERNPFALGAGAGHDVGGNDRLAGPRRQLEQRAPRAVSDGLPEPGHGCLLVWP